MNPTPEIQQAYMDNCAFCRTAGAACYGNYSDEVLLDYLNFHCGQRTYFWVRQAGCIVGNAVAWRLNAAAMHAMNAARGMVFDWTPDNPEGDSLFVGTIIATQPGVLVTLMQQIAERFPNLANLHWFTYRHGRLVTLTRPAIRRLLRKASYGQRR